MSFDQWSAAGEPSNIASEGTTQSSSDLQSVGIQYSVFMRPMYRQREAGKGVQLEARWGRRDSLSLITREPEPTLSLSQLWATTDPNQAQNWARVGCSLGHQPHGLQTKGRLTSLSNQVSQSTTTTQAATQPYNTDQQSTKANTGFKVRKWWTLLTMA